MDIDFKNADKVIETLLSKIFFFGDKVYKFYKWQKAFYGDLSDINFRKEFITEDFFWNNIMSPEIYKELLFCKNENGIDDLCIAMNRLKNEETLTDFIEKGKINNDILKNFVNIIIEKERKITDFRQKEFSILLVKNLGDIEKEEIEDLRNWCYMAESKLPREKTDLIISRLLAVLELEEYKDWAKIAHKSACVDGNGDNIIIAPTGGIQFIDILSPKFNWRVKDEVFNLSRIAADISALTGNISLSSNLYDDYEELTGLRVGETVRKLYETRGAMIQVAYRIILNQNNRAEKYLNFVEHGDFC
jgi:aminoglycoside phosphotransferase family enzyme